MLYNKMFMVGTNNKENMSVDNEMVTVLQHQWHKSLAPYQLY